MAISMAPGLSKVIVYMAGPYGNWHDILNRMATDNLAKQLSCSWYIPGGGADPVADQIFQQMAAQGQSFFNASGDDDAYTGPMDFPGETPYIMQVGGTTLTTTGPGGAWVSEKVWNWGNGIGSGGGISTRYAIPSYQTDISMTPNQGSTTMRNIPDVALTADNVYVRADGQDYEGRRHQLRRAVVGGLHGAGQPAGRGSGQAGGGLHQPGGVCHRQRPPTTPRASTTSPPATTPAPAAPPSSTRWRATTCAPAGARPPGQSLINALATPDPLLVTPRPGLQRGSRRPVQSQSRLADVDQHGHQRLELDAGEHFGLVYCVAHQRDAAAGRGGRQRVGFCELPSASALPAGSVSSRLAFTNVGQRRWRKAARWP